MLINHYQFGVNDLEEWLNQTIIFFEHKEPGNDVKIYNWFIRGAFIIIALFWMFILLSLTN